MIRQRRTFGCLQRVRKETYRLRWTDAGRRKSETVYGSRVDAERRLAEIQLTLDQSKRHMLTIGEIFDKYVYPDYVRKCTPGTLKNVHSYYNGYVKPQYAKTYADDIHVQAVQDWLLSIPFGAAKGSIVILRLCLRQAVLLELIEHSPLDIKLTLPKDSTRAVSKAIINAADIDTYYNAVRDSIVESCFILGACAGLRVGESLGVKIGEVEPYRIDSTLAAVVPVRREVDDLGRIVTNADGSERVKTPQSIRYAVVLEPYASRLLELQRIAADRGDVYLTDAGTGSPIGKIMIRRKWYALLDSAGLKRILLRNLRPTFATAAHHEYGMLTEDVARLLGHSRPIITYETYQRPNKDAVVKAALRARDN